MNYQVFNYMPSPSVATTNPPPRPICVTPSALSPLLYAILYSIEFQSPVGPRPATLREHSAGRSSGTLGGGSSGVAVGGTAASTAALLTSAVSVMSSFWGRTSTSAPPSQQQHQQRSMSAFGAAGGSVIANPTAAGSLPRALTLDEEAELAALQRQHEQPFVVPVTQVLHKLGGVHITVRETHNPTITTAYARVMEEVEAIVAEHEQRLTRQALRFASFPGQSGMGAAMAGSVSPSTSTLLHSGGQDGAAAKDEPTAERYTSTVPPVELRRLALPPASPTSPSRSVVRMGGSPASGATAAAAWCTTATATNASSGNVYPDLIDEFTPGQEEVGLMLSVRLLSREVTRWRITHERPLAEWRFPIIRTANERMMIRPRTQNPSITSPAMSSVATGFVPQDPRDVGGDGGTAACDFILVNDAAQMHQVLEFILKSSYQTTSMETFTDFTSGELVFDAHVQERRRFL
jgi:hypothetical protein